MMKAVYDPVATFDIKVSEVEFLRTQGGRQLMARVYRPQGPGPFPTVLVQEKFAAAYRAAGGVCELTIFDGSEHEWVAKPGPQTDRAREMVRAFIARRLKA